MFNNFKISPFVRLNLLTNGKPTYISVFDIQQIYEDTSGKGQEGVRIHFSNNDYTFVEGPLDKVMYAIDEVLNPEWYKEAEEEPSINDAIVAAKVLKNFCMDKMCCDCYFHKENKDCILKEEFPSCWPLPKRGFL